MGGGGAESVPRPEPPEPPSLTAQIKEFAAAYPTLAKTQMEFLPMFARASNEVQRELNPIAAGLTEFLAKDSLEGIEKGFSDAEEAAMQDRFQGSLGTNIGAPVGARAVSRQFRLDEAARRDQFRNQALALSGRQPIPQAPSIDQFSGGFTPGSALQFGSNRFNTQANIFGTQAGMFNTAQQARQSGANAMTSGLFGLGSALLSSKVYKENIVENTIDSLDVLKQLEIVEFDYKDVDKKHHIGVIVEDSPDILCAEEGDRLDIVNVVGVLLDANKKLLERVEALEEVL